MIELNGRASMPKSFQSIKYTRFPNPNPQAELSVSWDAPAVNPPSPSKANTFTSGTFANFNANASPAATGEPCPLGPVLNLKNKVFPSISAWPGKPPFRRSESKSSQTN